LDADTVDLPLDRVLEQLAVSDIDDGLAS